MLLNNHQEKISENIPAGSLVQDAATRLLNYLSLVACFCAITVIALGAFTRLIDAGLGCPDWPGCYGQLIAPLHKYSRFVVYRAWAEMIHRYMAGILSSLVFFIVICIFKNHRTDKKIQSIFAGCLIVLVIYQIILGRWTVTLKLLPEIVTQHLLGGLLILTILWLIYLSSKRSRRAYFNSNSNSNSNSNANSKFNFSILFASIAWVILFFQIFLGAWTSTHYASLSCSDFPFCINQTPFMRWDIHQAFSLSDEIGKNYQGGSLPDIARQTIHMAHRLGAFIFTLYWFIFSFFFLRKKDQHSAIILSFYTVWGCLSLQIFLGMVNILFKLPVFTSVLHTLTAALLLLGLSTFIFRLYYFCE